MKIAAIDIGSNSLHMVIVEVGASGGFHVIDREKEIVRLGSSTLSRGQLSAAARKASAFVWRSTASAALIAGAPRRCGSRDAGPAYYWASRMMCPTAVDDAGTW